jgi:hypothetical protein
MIIDKLTTVILLETPSGREGDTLTVQPLSDHWVNYPSRRTIADFNDDEV